MSATQDFRPFAEYFTRRFEAIFGPVEALECDDGSCRMTFPHAELRMAIDYEDGWIEGHLVPKGFGDRDPGPFHVRHHLAKLNAAFDPPTRGAFLNDAHFSDFLALLEPLRDSFSDGEAAQRAFAAVSRQAAPRKRFPFGLGRRRS